MYKIALYSLKNTDKIFYCKPVGSLLGRSPVFYFIKLQQLFFEEFMNIRFTHLLIISAIGILARKCCKSVDIANIDLEK